MKKKMLVVCLAAAILLLVAVGFVLFLAYGPVKVSPPHRPAQVPASAVWKGGADGGFWIDCKPCKDRESAYDCATYNEQTGEVNTRGTFVLRRVVLQNHIYENVDLIGLDRDIDEFVQSSLDWYDGEAIHLTSGLALVPDGTVVYPYRKDHGIKQEFKEGIPVGDRIEY